MIAGIFHEGSGIGNQLHRYVAAKSRATTLGTQCAMANPHLFKAAPWMQLDYVPFNEDKVETFIEKKIIENGVDIRGYDPEFNFIKNNTIIDGEFQDERYFDVYRDRLKEWIDVEPTPIPEDTCVIGFRGGEYSIFPDLFLPQEYWREAISGFPKNFKFEVHTDDQRLASKFFPDYPIIHNPKTNWSAMRYAKYAIIANSSFYILPRLMRHSERPSTTIAPRYWARYNRKIWALPQNYYQDFHYIHHGENTD